MKMKLNCLIALAFASTVALFSGCKPAESKQPANPPAAPDPGAATIQTNEEKKAEAKPWKRVETIDDLSDFFPKPLGAIRVSMLGGGTHHDFDRWFNVSDSVTISYASTEPVNYTTNLTYFLEGIPNHDVLYLCNNSPMTNAEVNKAIFDFADKGGGFLLIHPALWYNWKNWPEWNRVMVGGGARSHDKYGPVEVVIDQWDHPIFHNIPKSFKVDDELYHFEPDPKGSPIEVLASGINPETGKKYPVVWITKHPKARIICISLGHDGSTHDNVAFRVMLQNCMAWVAKHDHVLKSGPEAEQTPAPTPAK